MGDEVVGYGGRDRSNASSSASMELGITRVALAMSSALRSMDTASHRRYTKATARVSHNMAWQQELQLKGSHPGCDERRDFWGPLCERTQSQRNKSSLTET